MKIKIDNNIYSFDSESGIDISIPMKFNDFLMKIASAGAQTSVKS